MAWHGVHRGLERPLFGRYAERETIERLLDNVREGFSGVLVLTGEPGIGKTRLLDHAAAVGVDLNVVRLVGVEPETRLGYAALHRLLRPFLHRIEQIPAPQQHALNATFGLVDTNPSDRYLVGLAALTLLSDVASEQPMLCLVDDVHWLDRESVETLAFVARRLHADSFGLVFAARDGAADGTVFAGLPLLRLAGLEEPEARQLLSLAVAGPLGAAVASRIVAGTGGNPLALLELTAHLGGDQLAGVAALPEPLPVSRMLEGHFRQSVAALPPDTQTLLLLMAAGPADDTAATWRAAGVLGLPARAAGPAVAAGILSGEAAVGFRHPLIRSAVYASAPAPERRRIHQALAATSDPDRRAWHLAEAAADSDDEAAAELHAAAERARARGGYSQQALFLSRAAELTTGPARRADRYLAAAQAHLTSGDPTAVRRVLDLATPDLRGPAERARALRIRASVEMFNTHVDRVPSMMLDAVAELGAEEPRLTRELLCEAMYAAIIGGDRLERTSLAEVAKAAADAWHDPAAPEWSADLVMEGLARRIAQGYADGAPVLRAALSRLRAASELQELNSPFSVMVSIAADELWDAEAKADIVQRLAAVDRREGALYGLVLSLLVLATGDIWDGRFAAAEARYAEADDYAAATGFPGNGEIHKALLYAWTGQESALRTAVATMYGLADSCGLGSLAHIASHALCLLHLGQGRYRQALAHALPPFVEDVPPIGNLVLPLLVEAAVRGGDRPAAAAALARIQERAPLAGTPWALGILARCRALTSGNNDAEKLYLESIELLGQAPLALEQAWSRLLFGEWLRRRKRRADARVPLRAAYESFESCGAVAFAERARVELLATGEVARKRTVQTLYDLTARERHVASLAASGSTNAEIATRLFVTTSTVEFHLNKVFRKLGITSRKQIAQVLKQGTAEQEQDQ